MKIIRPSTEILSRVERQEVMELLERAGRTCYKSEDRITSESANKFIRQLIVGGHEAMIEHFNITVKIVCDRGVTHEIVRHRIASYAQESTRYCNYGKDKFGNEITVIQPCWFKNNIEGQYKIEWDGLYGNCRTEPAMDKDESWWFWSMALAERDYFKLLALGWTPQQARSVLPNSLKTEIVVTMNLREWRHFFRLRTAETAHPQMREVARPLLDEFKQLLPALFEDITY